VPSKSKSRSVALFARWIVAGAFVGLLTSILIGGLIMPRHPNAGDGILVMMLLLILVPIGSLVGCIRAVMIFERDKPQIPDLTSQLLPNLGKDTGGLNEEQKVHLKLDEMCSNKWNHLTCLGNDVPNR
jgi:hypothetical protein